jgi:hypothetical protein
MLPLILPCLRTLVDPLIGQPYSRWTCAQLTRYLLLEGFGIDLDVTPDRLIKDVQEVWWHEDPDNPCDVARPWDLMVIAVDTITSNSVGLVVDDVYFAHTGPKTGVCYERLTRWRTRFLQIGRLRRLL